MAKGNGPRTPQRAAEDPLEDVRAAFGGDDTPPPGQVPSEDDAPGQGVSEPLATVTDRVEARAAVIAAWHADPTAQGFLHRGGRCGCRYIADRALDAVAPIQDEPEPSPED